MNSSLARILAGLLLASLILAGARVRAMDLVVTTLEDEVNGEENGLSLREAILLSNATPDHDTIFLEGEVYNPIIGDTDPSDGLPYPLAGDFDVTDDLTVQGVGMTDGTILEGYKVNRSLESPGRYILTIYWDTLEDHTVGFRQSAAFAEWRAIVGPFFAQPPVVEHLELVSKS